MKTYAITAAALILLVMAVACSPGGTGDMPARKLIDQRCSICHSTERIFSTRHSTQEWKVIIDRMIRHGASLDASEEKVLKDYLGDEYGKR